MPRWRSSLALLGRIEAQGQSCSSTSTTARQNYFRAVVPDFLAPSFHQSSTTTRRHNASSARVAFEHSAFDSAENSAESSRSAQKLSRSHTQVRNVDSTSYFDAGIPIRASSAFPSATIDDEIAYIDARLNAASDEADIDAVATELREGAILVEERRRVREARQFEVTQKDRAPPMADLNEHFLLSLLKKSFAVLRDTGSNDVLSMDRMVAKNLRTICTRIPFDKFSAVFLARFASKAGFKSAETVLNQLLHIMQQRVAHETTQAPASTAEDAGIPTTDFNNESVTSSSRILLYLMQSFSRCGQFKRVQDCFDLLNRHSLPANVFHYQLHLTALFRERASQLASKDQIDIERQSQQIQSDILAIKASMEANNVALDDTFVATVVHGLSAPLRSPLSKDTSAAQVMSAIRLVRTIFGQFIGTSRGKSYRSMPRLLSALINAEIDAIERDPRPRSKVPAQTPRIKNLIRQLNSGTVLDKSTAVGLLEGDTVTETRLASVSLRLRLSAALGEFDQGLEQLRLLLSIQPIMHAVAAEQRRELILKQRSGVIFLFSAAMQQRHGIEGQDTAFEVMQRAFSTQWFDRVWTGVCLPANPSSDIDPKAYNPDAIIMRLWKRWIHAWSIDYSAQGSWAQAHGAGERRGKHRTFTGAYPWQTLKRGLRLLNKTIDQYEIMHSTRATVAVPNNSELTTPPSHESGNLAFDCTKAPQGMVKFATLFNERNILDNMTKLTLRGGRPAANETVATHVHRRLTLLVRTLTRVNVPARVWENLENSMIKHLALIDREVLPTEAVRETMDEIELRKRQALLRNRPLMQALEEASLSGVGQGQGKGEELVRETGSIFVLRQMLETRAQMKKLKQQKETSSQSRAAFT